MVGAEGFEPPALCSQSRCATRLRYAPIFRLYRSCGLRIAAEQSYNQALKPLDSTRSHMVEEPVEDPDEHQQRDNEDRDQHPNQSGEEEPVFPRMLSWLFDVADE
jgi:hypothetical protein